MSWYTSDGNFLFDAESSVTLRKAEDGAETVTGTEAGVDLKPSGTAYWQNAGQTFQYMAAVVQTKTIDTADGDETYALTLEVADDSAFTQNLTTVGGPVNITKEGYSVIVLHGPTIDGLSADAKYMRIKHTLGGTTPSIVYGAWLTPVVGAH